MAHVHKCMCLRCARHSMQRHEIPFFMVSCSKLTVMKKSDEHSQNVPRKTEDLQTQNNMTHIKILLYVLVMLMIVHMTTLGEIIRVTRCCYKVIQPVIVSLISKPVVLVSSLTNTDVLSGVHST